ncbi:hypothetical protein D9M68_998870 [compost metagenome]
MEIQQAGDARQQGSDDQRGEYRIARQQAFAQQVGEQHGHHQQRLLLGGHANFQAYLEQHPASRAAVMEAGIRRMMWSKLPVRPISTISAEAKI